VQAKNRVESLSCLHFGAFREILAALGAGRWTLVTCR
jgi:hypothetical protein